MLDYKRRAWLMKISLPESFLGVSVSVGVGVMVGVNSASVLGYSG